MMKTGHAISLVDPIVMPARVPAEQLVKDIRRACFYG